MVAMLAIDRSTYINSWSFTHVGETQDRRSSAGTLHRFKNGILCSWFHECQAVLTELGRKFPYVQDLINRAS